MVVPTTPEPSCIKSEENIAIILSVCYSIIALFAICGNSLIIYAFYKFKKLRTPTNIIVIAISISDIILALLVPFYVSFYFDVEYKCNILACKFRYFFSMFCAYWSLLLMIGLAVDRYIAVLKPLRYNWLVRKERVVWFNIITAVYMGIICTIPFFNLEELGDGEFDADEVSYTCIFFLLNYYSIHRILYYSIYIRFALYFDITP
jgi:hypothetical protein